MITPADPLVGWRSGWARTDRRWIYDWAHDPKEGLFLPPAYAQPGRFDVSTSRHMEKPFQAVQNDAIREATFAGAIQTAKTLIVEISIAWVIRNSPGPIMWTMQTDDDAKEHCNQRFMELLKSCRHIREIMPQDRHKAKIAEIYFGPFFLVVNGANKNNLQRVSVRWKFNSECWLWDQGLLEFARGRVSAFEKAGNSKVINESQGSNEGDDFDRAFNAGTQEIWGIRCFGCSQLSPLQFAETDREKTGKTCVVWNKDAKREDGSWNIGRAAETARWVCPKCGHEHDDSAKTRARWNADGDYVVTNPTAAAEKASFRWEGLVGRPMGALVAQFLEARRDQKMGVDQPMQDFVRQRRAMPWRADTQRELVTLMSSGYRLSDIAAAPMQKIDGEINRFCTVDRQRDHFWVTIRAWSSARSRLLYRGKVATAETIEDIRIKYGVDSRMVFQDSQAFTADAYRDCARFGWTALHGSGDDRFTWIDAKGEKSTRYYSQVKTAVIPEGPVNYIFWASDPVKDILAALRDRKAPSFEWEIPADADAVIEGGIPALAYSRQIQGDQKKEVLNKNTNRMQRRWVRVGQNHFWDCEAMQVVAAIAMRVLAAPESTPTSTPDPATP